MYHDTDFWRTVFIVTAAVGQTLFVALYALFPWHETFLGRALFFKAFALGLLLVSAVVGWIFDWPKEDVTFVALYSGLTLGIWLQFAAFVYVRARGRQREVSGNGVGREHLGE